VTSLPAAAAFVFEAGFLFAGFAFGAYFVSSSSPMTNGSSYSSR